MENVSVEYVEDLRYELYCFLKNAGVYGTVTFDIDYDVRRYIEDNNIKNYRITQIFEVGTITETIIEDNLRE